MRISTGTHPCDFGDEIAELAVKARIAAHEFDVEDLDAVSIDEALDPASYSIDRATLALVLYILKLARAAS